MRMHAVHYNYASVALEGISQELLTLELVTKHLSLN